MKDLRPGGLTVMNFEQQDKYIISERKLIFLMINHESVVRELLENKISSDLFSAEYQHQFLVECVYSEYLDLNSSNPRLLSRDSYTHYLTQKYGKNASILTALHEYDKCSNICDASPNDLGMLKDNLLDGFTLRNLKTSLERLRINTEKMGAFKATQDLIIDLSFANSDYRMSRSEFINLKEYEKEYYAEKKKQRDNPEVLIKCGIEEFDKAMVGGLSPQTLALIVADTGCGKTTTMLSMGIKIAKNGHNVLFVSLEMNKLRLTDRIISHLSHIEFEDVSIPQKMSDEKYKAFENAWKKWDDVKGNFYILETSEWITVSTLRREIELRVMTFKPEVVIIDYIGILKPENKYGQRHDLELGEISKALRFMGKKYGFSTISACQLNREAIRRMKKNKEHLAGSEDLRGSGELSNDADYIFALFPSDAEHELKAQVLKSRYGKAHNTFTLTFDGKTCYIGDHINWHPPNINDLNSYLVNNSTENSSEDELEL